MKQNVGLAADMKSLFPYEHEYLYIKHTLICVKYYVAQDTSYNSYTQELTSKCITYIQ